MRSAEIVGMSVFSLIAFNFVYSCIKNLSEGKEILIPRLGKERRLSHNKRLIASVILLS